MDIKKINILSDIINKEIIINNILFTFGLGEFQMKSICILHTYWLYRTARLLATYGINIEIDEPQYIILSTPEIGNFCSSSIGTYYNYINLKNCDNSLKKCLYNFINIRSSILSYIKA